eukprot:scaffold1269_cov400-Prasinococcus_capsulatus_cf.AAC.3
MVLGVYRDPTNSRARVSIPESPVITPSSLRGESNRDATLEASRAKPPAKARIASVLSSGFFSFRTTFSRSGSAVSAAIALSYPPWLPNGPFDKETVPCREPTTRHSSRLQPTCTNPLTSALLVQSVKHATS